MIAFRPFLLGENQRLSVEIQWQRKAWLSPICAEPYNDC